MSFQGTSSFAAVIQDHLVLRRRNAALGDVMPLSRYMDRAESARPAHHVAEGQDDEDIGVLWPEAAA
jgi:hypothetical protein